MANKYFIGILLVLLILPLSSAIGADSQKNVDDAVEIISAGVSEVTATRAQNMEQVRSQIAERKKELATELANRSLQEQNVYRHQNTVREAVHTLLILRNSGEISSGIGQNVSRIAIEFNNSVNKTIMEEKKLQKRNAIIKFFLGANEEETQAAEEIESEISRNRERIQELRRIRNECDCSEETKELLDEQVNNMEQEQNRLENVAKNGKSKGLFGRFFN